MRRRSSLPPRPRAARDHRPISASLWLCRFADDVSTSRNSWRCCCAQDPALRRCGHDRSASRKRSDCASSDAATGRRRPRLLRRRRISCMPMPPRFPRSPARAGASTRSRCSRPSSLRTSRAARSRDALYHNPIWQFELTFDGLDVGRVQLSRPRRAARCRPDGPVPACQGSSGRSSTPTRPTAVATARRFATGDGATTTFTLRPRARRLPRAGRLGDERLAGDGRRRRAGLGLVAGRAQQPRLRDGAGERRVVVSASLLLRLSMPLRR